MAYPNLHGLVLEKATEWGMAHRPDLAFHWYERCYVNMAFGTAVVFPLLINGDDCIIAACSTSETNSMQGHHSSAVGIIHEPAWMRNLCYKYNGLALLNFEGLTDPKYAESAQPIGYLQDLLDEYCPSVGIPDWRQRYGQLRGGPYLQGLRELFRRLEVPVFLEISSGSSRRVYAGFDVYVRTFAGPYAPNLEARFLLYERHVRTENRRIREPWDWWLFSVWESCGQAEANFEYERDFVEDLREQIVLSVGRLPSISERRILILAHQLNPPGILALNAKGKGNGKGKDQSMI